jgi:phosphate transport system substrate-binding protein
MTNSKRSLLLMWGMLLVACATPPPAAPPAPTPLVGRIAFVGSTTIQPLVEQLQVGYGLLYPDMQLDIAAGGSEVGLNAIREGSADIGMVSRTLRSGELGPGSEIFPIAIDVLGIVVHPSNMVASLSMAQLQGIYTGKIVNWRELGGADLPIVPIVREVSSGTRGAFDELVLAGLAPLASANVQVTAGEVEAKVAETPAAIGYVGFGNLMLDVKVLAIDGVLPSQQSVLAKRYTLSRPLQLLIGPLSRSVARSFIQFALSDEGQRIIAADGWVPVRVLK